MKRCVSETVKLLIQDHMFIAFSASQRSVFYIADDNAETLFFEIFLIGFWILNGNSWW